MLAQKSGSKRMNRYKEVALMVENGTYFEDARRWYVSKFLFLYCMRASLFFVGVLMLVAAYIMIDCYQTTFASMRVPFSIYAKDQVNYFPIIKPLAFQKEPLEVSIARYFVTKYVTLREAYAPFDYSEENKPTLLSKVGALSTKKTFKEFEDYIDPDENPESPIALYKNQVRRTITINNVELISNNNVLEKAVVEFTATERSQSDAKNTKHKAEIDMLSSDITKVFEKKEELYFLVTKYKSYELSK